MPHISNISQVDENDKFIIYKGSGGLIHMFTGIVYAIKKSLKMNRILIIDVITHSAFGRKFSDYFVINDSNLKYSENYEIIPEKYLSKEDLIILKKSYVSLYTNSYNNNSYMLNGKDISQINEFSNDDIIVFTSCMGPNYFPSNIIFTVKECILDRLTKTTKPLKPYISVHFRNTDRKNKITVFIKKIKDTINKTGINIVYLATDDYNAFDVIKQELNENIELMQYCPPINANGGNIHFGDKDKDRVIYNSLLDMYIIFNSTHFIPSMNSGFSKYIIHAIKNKDDIFNIASNTNIIE